MDSSRNCNLRLIMWLLSGAIMMTLSLPIVSGTDEGVVQNTPPYDITTVQSSTNPIPQFEVDINHCASGNLTQFHGIQGMVRGFINKDKFDGTFGHCYLQITVPEGLYIKAYSQVLNLRDMSVEGFDFQNCFLLIATSEYNFICTGSNICIKWDCYVPKSPLILMSGNMMYIKIMNMKDNDRASIPSDFWLYFVGVSDDLRNSFIVQHDSGSTGYITLPGFDQKLYYPQCMNISYTLVPPLNQVIMLSFTHFQLSTCNIILYVYDFLEMYSVTNNTVQTKLWKKCGTQGFEAEVYDTPLLFKFHSECRGTAPGIRILFSFHTLAKIPLKVAGGLFDCSRDYQDFKQHLDCNLKVECQQREDETYQCPFSSGHCDGALDFQGKCVTYNEFKDKERLKTWNIARKQCRDRGGDLATFRTQREWDRATILPDIISRSDCVYIGLHFANISNDRMYWKTWRWVDGTTSYVDRMSAVYAKPFSLYQDICSNIYLSNFGLIYPVGCTRINACKYFLCETKMNLNRTKTKPSVLFPKLNDSLEYQHVRKMTDTSPVAFINLNTSLEYSSRLHFGLCLDGHVVHDFLSCDFNSQCGVDLHLDRCDTVVGNGTTEVVVSVKMFRCHMDGDTVPYTLVCDFRHDCTDSSDEDYCVHKEDPSAFRCANGQNLPKEKECDAVKDCPDAEDEMDCYMHEMYFYTRTTRSPPPAIIHLDGRGNFTVVPMNATDPCPQTHFRCPGQSMYCMPVYLRCNVVKDCPFGEDEQDCDEFKCPGFYGCRGSKVCLHLSYLCDGWPQCPQRDDEILCNASCPPECHCQGLAFVCHTPFAASEFPDLRYLDAGGSNMTSLKLDTNVYLIHLNLAACKLTTWSPVRLCNLQRLDLSDNQITTFSVRNVRFLQNLRYISLKGNPLTTLERDDPDMKQNTLLDFDLSVTRLSHFDSSILKQFPSIQKLNLSSSSLRIISDKGFSHLPKLTHLDLRRCELDHFPRHVFAGLEHLDVIYAENYKLCCKAVLPKIFNENYCYAPKDEISSCEDLLRSNVYRTFLWMTGLFSVVGNAGCFLFRLILQRSSMSKSGYNIFVTNLSVSDFLMGIYLVLIGAADDLYRGNYLWNEKTWKDSTECSVAGFLSFLSNEVSAFIICLITIDRFIVVRFPFSLLRFKGRSAAVASGLVWGIGFFLAAIPLFPAFSQWRYYSQTGICIPLPVTRSTFRGQSYSFSIMIVFNFAVFVSIALGQAVIYWSIRANSMDMADSNSASRDLTIARRLITVVVTNFLCWFPIGVLGLLAFHGTAVPGEVNVALAIFVLPLNSALNPFLYTFNMLMEKQRKAREARLLRFLQSRLLTAQTNANNAKP